MVLLRVNIRRVFINLVNSSFPKLVILPSYSAVSFLDSSFSCGTQSFNVGWKVPKGVDFAQTIFGRLVMFLLMQGPYQEIYVLFDFIIRSVSI